MAKRPLIMKTRLLLVLILIFAGTAAPVWAQSSTTDLIDQQREESKESAVSASSELLELLKKRAILKSTENKEQREQEAAEIDRIIAEKERQMKEESDKIIELLKQQAVQKAGEQEQTAPQQPTGQNLIELLKQRAEEKAKEQWLEQTQQEIEQQPKPKDPTQKWTQDAQKALIQESLEEKRDTTVEDTRDIIELLKERAVQRANTTQQPQTTEEKMIQEKEKTILQSSREIMNLFTRKLLLVDTIKKIDLKEKEKKKRTRWTTVDGTFGAHYVYNSNVNTDKADEGDNILRNYLSLDWKPEFVVNRIVGDLGFWYYGDRYFEQTDSSFRIVALNPSIQFTPWKNRAIVLQPGIEWSSTHYPNNPSSSQEEIKLYHTLRHTFWKNWSQELRYSTTWGTSDPEQNARDGSGTDIPDVKLEKTKYTVDYDFSIPAGKNKFKIKQQVYRETSNDAFTDYYHAWAYKVTGEIGRSITEKIYGKYSYSYQMKNYDERPSADVDAAQEDTTYTNKVTLYYFLNSDWLFDYNFTFTRADSNATSYDYSKFENTVGFYYNF
jgi:chemotaxis protein histidine kinase CheA